ncbi:hypothetical protein QBC47DRAFT_374668 [Echria macrotheca]|uniref:Uncharacterized protein n=1 Tax=Echria macrotheca TaxID=438768 RepID=A0AAJ0BHM2_9PEZI|nr:hypothetical protein QBC47DRAFT_374668 [Echria macrotheca]
MARASKIPFVGLYFVGCPMKLMNSPYNRVAGWLHCTPESPFAGSLPIVLFGIEVVLSPSFVVVLGSPRTFLYLPTWI